MSDRFEDFDPYEEWLEIPPEEQPPSYYRLLGVEEFEEDLAVIDAAAKKRTAYLHPMGSGPERASVHRLLGEVAKARRTLLSEESKRKYDEQLLQVFPNADSELENVHSKLEADAEYVEDDAGDASPAASFHIDAGTESSIRSASGQPSKQKARAQKATPSRKSQKQASARNKTDRTRKKQWANDWRVHAASIVILLTVVTGFVLYTNSRGNRRAAAPIAKVPATSRPAFAANGQNSAQVGRQKTSRRANQQASVARQSNLNRANSAAARQRASGLNAGGTGKSQLALALEAQMAKSADAAGAAKPKSGTGSSAKEEDATTASGKPNSSSANPKSDNRKANPGKGSKGKAPTSVSMDLGGDWVESLESIADDEKFSTEKFEVAKGPPAMRFEDGRLVLQPVSGTTKPGILIVKNVKVKLGESAALETNLRKGLPEGASVGLIVGPIRVRLDSKKNNLEIRMHSQTLGAIAPKASDVVRLVVVREKENPKRFRWLVQAGEKAITGRAELQQDVAAELPVGLFFRGPKNMSGKPVWVRDLAVGSLSRLPGFKSSKLVSIPAPK